MKNKHIATVLLHDYYHRGVFQNVIHKGQWSRLETRIEKNVDDVCELFDRYSVKATFFTLGWIAEKNPKLIRRIVDQGHEIASAGYETQSVRSMSADEFRTDLRQAQYVLEKAGANKIIGYRAAFKWIQNKDDIAFDILKQEGYEYDASFRSCCWSVGKQKKQRFLHKRVTSDGEIWEVPVSTSRILGFNIPISGGNYIRQLPEKYLLNQFFHWQQNSDAPFVLYFHPWELDPDIPRINATNYLGQLRQYRNLDRFAQLLPRYFDGNEFTSISNYLQVPLTFPSIAKEKNEREKISLTGKTGPTISVVVPCYNESTSLKFLSNSLTELVEDPSTNYKFKFVFVDDCSSDNTFYDLSRIFKKKFDSTIIRHSTNQGVAAAIQTGIQAVDTDIVCSIDADCTYDPLLLTHMIPMLEKDIDMVVASPYHKNGRVLNVPNWRLFLSRTLSKLYQRALNNKLATYTACFRVYRRKSVADIKLENSNFIGVLELLARLDKKGGKIVEFPTVLQSRLLGYSKMKVAKTVLGHFKFLFKFSHCEQNGKENNKIESSQKPKTKLASIDVK